MPLLQIKKVKISSKNYFSFRLRWSFLFLALRELSRDDCKSSLVRLSNALLYFLLAGSSSHSTIDDTIKQTIASESIFAMNASHNLASGVESFDRSLGSQDVRVLVNLKTAHGVMNDGCDDGDVEAVTELDGHVGEELLAPGVGL